MKMKIKTKHKWLDELSPENVQRMHTVLKIILNEIELTGVNELTANRIPIQRFENAGFGYLEVIELINKIDRKNGSIEVINLSSYWSDDETMNQVLWTRTILKFGEFISKEESEKFALIRINNLELLRSLEKEIVITKDPVKEKSLVRKSLSFDADSGDIIIDDTPCKIPKNTNQFFLCKKIFSEPQGSRIKEIDILDLVDWAKDGKRCVYDAMLAVNRKIKKDVGIDKLLCWRNNHVWINEDYCIRK